MASPADLVMTSPRGRNDTSIDSSLVSEAEGISSGSSISEYMQDVISKIDESRKSILSNAFFIAISLAEAWIQYDFLIRYDIDSPVKPILADRHKHHHVSVAREGFHIREIFGILLPVECHTH